MKCWLKMWWLIYFKESTCWEKQHVPVSAVMLFPWRQDPTAGASSLVYPQKNLCCLSNLKLSRLRKYKYHTKNEKSYHVFQPTFSRIARRPARVPAWAFCGGSPQLCGVQLRGRAALPQQRLLVPVLSALSRMQLSLRRHQGHGGEPGEEQAGLERLQPRVHGIR